MSVVCMAMRVLDPVSVTLPVASWSLVLGSRNPSQPRTLPAGDLEDLLQRLERLAREHCAAPLMTLAAAGAAGREGEGAAGGGWVARRRRGPSGAGVLDEDYTAEGLGEGGGGGQLGEDWELV